MTTFTIKKMYVTKASSYIIELNLDTQGTRTPS